MKKKYKDELPTACWDDGRVFSYNAHQNLEGQILTIIDASISDIEQRKAVKDLIRQTLWGFVHEWSCFVDKEDHNKLREKQKGRGIGINPFSN